jgi:hypothetical protein
MLTISEPDDEATRSLESLAVYRDPVLLNLRLPAEGTERITVTYASAALFTVLRTRPALGRAFTSEDSRPGFHEHDLEDPDAPVVRVLSQPLRCGSRCHRSDTHTQ